MIIIYAICKSDSDSSSRKSYSSSYRRRRKNTYWEQQEKFRNDLGYHQWLGYQ